MSDDDVAMQTRCVKCLTEHYALAVIDISYGGIHCPSCGHESQKMTKDEYMDALSRAREADETVHLRWDYPPRQRRPHE